ncbi:hypothetical protein HG531_007520 [Fusarium graminearum]|nr:hypothetical protein HG531_007520 [Fusarium graminearum]
MGVLVRRKCERVEANVYLFSTWETPAVELAAFFWSPQLPVAISVALDAALEIVGELLVHSSYDATEELCQQGTSKIESFLSKVITIIRFTAAERTLKKLVHHCLLLKDILCDTDTLLTAKTGLVSVSTLADEVEGNFSVLNTEGFLDTRTKHFQHLTIISVVANVVENILVRYDTQSSENDSNRKIRLDEW